MKSGSGSLDGKVAVVTGASRGIGKAIAVAFAREGASVCCAARTVPDIEQTVREIEDAGGTGIAVETDVTDLESVKRMFSETSDKFGGLDILVANAGGNFDHRLIEDGDPKDWLLTVDVNLIGAYHCAKAAIPYLKAQGGGKIITIGSGIGHKGRPKSSAYAVAKAGLSMLTRMLAQELMQYNISANELIPGPVLTEGAQARNLGNENSVFNIEGEWFKEPEDVTPLALFIATQPTIGPSAQSFSLMRRDN